MEACLDHREGGKPPASLNDVCVNHMPFFSGDSLHPGESRAIWNHCRRRLPGRLRLFEPRQRRRGSRSERRLYPHKGKGPKMPMRFPTPNRLRFNVCREGSTAEAERPLIADNTRARSESLLLGGTGIASPGADRISPMEWRRQLRVGGSALHSQPRIPCPEYKPKGIERHENPRTLGHGEGWARRPFLRPPK